MASSLPKDDGDVTDLYVSFDGGLRKITIEEATANTPINFDAALGVIDAQKMIQNMWPESYT